MPQAPRIIVALDYPDTESALALVDQLDPKRCRLKVGKTMFTRFGPSFVKELIKRDFTIFLDLKFHDIPHQVAGACLAAADLGVWMINLHAMGGLAMMVAAREALMDRAEKPLLTAVTILTSLASSDLPQIGLSGTAIDNVVKLAQLTCEAGLDGVVASSQEAVVLREKCGSDFVLVTPGIRLKAAVDKDDQSRILTPQQAIAQGVDYIVVGRPITQADDPMKVLKQIELDIASVAV